MNLDQDEFLEKIKHETRDVGKTTIIGKVFHFIGRNTFRATPRRSDSFFVSFSTLTRTQRTYYFP